jgi:hypothetical protein
MAIVGFASYDHAKHLEQCEDFFWVDSELFVWARAENYKNDLLEFYYAVEAFAIQNRAGDPEEYRDSYTGKIDTDGYADALKRTIQEGACQYPPFCNYNSEGGSYRDQNGQPRLEFMMGPRGRQARISFLKDCLNSQSQNGC